ncbi:hypothetical protein TNCV_4229031 [Trichonephila clavipes]|nr:hypothetical protein TNCV_4229031 [Trichonephila clavipes]
MSRTCSMGLRSEYIESYSNRRISSYFRVQEFRLCNADLSNHLYQTHEDRYTFLQRCLPRPSTILTIVVLFSDVRWPKSTPRHSPNENMSRVTVQTES